MPILKASETKSTDLSDVIESTEFSISNLELCVLAMSKMNPTETVTGAEVNAMMNLIHLQLHEILFELKKWYLPSKMNAQKPCSFDASGQLTPHLTWPPNVTKTLQNLHTLTIVCKPCHATLCTQRKAQKTVLQISTGILSMPTTYDLSKFLKQK